MSDRKFEEREIEVESFEEYKDDTTLSLNKDVSSVFVKRPTITICVKCTSE